MHENSSILVAGAGSWGTALALVLANNGHSVSLWGHRAEHVAALREQRVNARYLPNILFPRSLVVIDQLDEGLAQSPLVVIAVPSLALRNVLTRIHQIGKTTGVVSACKGLEHGTHLLVHEVIDEILGTQVRAAVISGPTFAAEVAAGLPSAAVVASNNIDYADEVAKLFHCNTFRVYSGSDVVGVEVGGAVKNVLAIAAGIVDGLGLGSNARAALMTRGIAEISRLGVTLGGKSETFMGLAGLGDLVLTCTGDLSRNRRFGMALAGGRTIAEALTEVGQVVEGAGTAAEVEALAQKLDIEMPIVASVASLLRGECSPADALARLMARAPTSEFP